MGKGQQCSAAIHLGSQAKQRCIRQTARMNWGGGGVGRETAPPPGPAPTPTSPQPFDGWLTNSRVDRPSSAINAPGTTIHWPASLISPHHHHIPAQ